MIDFSGYTRKAIQEDMLGQVPDDLDKRQGSMIQTAIGPVAWYLEGTYMILDQIQTNSNPQTAVGEALDLITITRGISRNAARAAVRKGTFNVPIPSGSQFKTINGAASLIFISGDAVTNESSEGNYVYLLTCATPGSAGNSYTGAILPITVISGLTSASMVQLRRREPTKKQTNLCGPDILRALMWRALVEIYRPIAILYWRLME